VLGTVTFSNGLTELTPAGASSVINLGADTGPAALAIDLPTLLASPEPYEGRLLKVSNLSNCENAAVNYDSNLDISPTQVEFTMPEIPGSFFTRLSVTP
jgi:hypothetical protein